MRFHAWEIRVCLQKKCLNLNFDRLAVMGFIEARDIILSGFLSFDKHLVFKLNMMTIPVYRLLQPYWRIRLSKHSEHPFLGEVAQADDIAIFL